MLLTITVCVFHVEVEVDVVLARFSLFVRLGAHFLLVLPVSVPFVEVRSRPLALSSSSSLPQSHVPPELFAAARVLRVSSLTVLAAGPYELFGSPPCTRKIIRKISCMCCVSHSHMRVGCGRPCAAQSVSSLDASVVPPWVREGRVVDAGIVVVVVVVVVVSATAPAREVVQSQVRLGLSVYSLSIPRIRTENVSSFFAVFVLVVPRGPVLENAHLHIVTAARAAVPPCNLATRLCY